MKKTVKKVKKLVISFIGFPILAIGIILIPLPGPGLIICFLGLLILSTEFEWASKYTDMARGKIYTIYKKSKARADKIEHPANKKEQD